jgi:hypothetical protein
MTKSEAHQLGAAARNSRLTLRQLSDLVEYFNCQEVGELRAEAAEHDWPLSRYLAMVIKYRHADEIREAAREFHNSDDATETALAGSEV